jgi:hypothetical protein
MIRRWLCLMLAFALLAGPARAEEPVSFLEDTEEDSVGKIVRTYDSPTLKYTVEKFLMEKERCYLCRIWVRDPERQIRKATAEWKKNIALPEKIAGRIPEAALAVNGSGYVSPVYPWIPENYPGKNEDYYYTPLGSLTVTDGEVFRDLESVPYYGLTLDADGLQMYTGADNAEVLATAPAQTWSFYVNCPMLRENEDLLPADWAFADARAARTIIGRLDRNNYLILSVTRERGRGLTLRRCQEFFRENFRTEWVYNLDGGPSSALLVREKGRKKLTLLAGGTARDADVMAFTE